MPPTPEEVAAAAAAAKEAADKAEADRVAAEEAARAARQAEEEKLPDAVKADLAAARKAATDAATEATAAIARATAAETALKAKNDAELSELERAQNRTRELEESMAAATQRERDSAVRYEVAIHAGKLNLHDAETAHTLLDLTKVEFNEAGRPTNVETLLTELVAAKPFLVKPKGAEGIDPTPDGKDKPMSDEERTKLAGGRAFRARL